MKRLIRILNQIEGHAHHAGVKSVVLERLSQYGKIDDAVRHFNPDLAE
jgi:hypothetical protein